MANYPTGHRLPAMFDGCFPQAPHGMISVEGHHSQTQLPHHALPHPESNFGPPVQWGAGCKGGSLFSAGHQSVSQGFGFARNTHSDTQCVPFQHSQSVHPMLSQGHPSPYWGVSQHDLFYRNGVGSPTVHPVQNFNPHSNYSDNVEFNKGRRFESPHDANVVSVSPSGIGGRCASPPSLLPLSNREENGVSSPHSVAAKASNPDRRLTCDSLNASPCDSTFSASQVGNCDNPGTDTESILGVTPTKLNAYFDAVSPSQVGTTCSPDMLGGLFESQLEQETVRNIDFACALTPFMGVTPYDQFDSNTSLCTFVGRVTTFVANGRTQNFFVL